MNAKIRVIGAVVLLAMAGVAAVASANTGAITQLSGTLSVKKPDGSVRILANKSEIQNGDQLNTERDSFAQIKFSDGGQVTMKPNTVIKIENFKFDEQKPQEDSFLFNLVKGGLRAVTGVVGKRNKDAFRMGTATATVGIRGTTFSADDCVSGNPECGKLDPAVYVSVADGEINVSNSVGEQAYAAGQFGMIAPNQRPLFLSTDPGLQFTPPATFIQSIQAGSVVNSGKNQECAVRR